MNAMNSAPQTKEEKYAAVTKRLRELGVRVPQRGAWKSTAGQMKGSQHFAEAMRLGAEWRTEENRRSLESAHVDS
jgi:hypothetical protein